jgi:hypothetical protein
MSDVTPTQSPDDARPFASERFWAVVLLSLPSIVGTAFFLTGVILTAIFGPGNAPAGDPFRELTAAEHVKLSIGFTIFIACYFGAAFGPVVLPFAAWQAFVLSRRRGARSRVAIWAWTFVVLAVVATALFWGWLIDLDIFV